MKVISNVSHQKDLSSSWNLRGRLTAKVSARTIHRELFLSPESWLKHNPEKPVSYTLWKKQIQTLSLGRANANKQT